uniref:Uncharacterized protein n=1 Tax=Glossina pallidipes TaxID=7398 RepID=A0A1A9ZL23_GLOPL
MEDDSGFSDCQNDYTRLKAPSQLFEAPACWQCFTISSTLYVFSSFGRNRNIASGLSTPFVTKLVRNVMSSKSSKSNVIMYSNMTTFTHSQLRDLCEQQPILLS